MNAMRSIFKWKAMAIVLALFMLPAAAQIPQKLHELELIYQKDVVKANKTIDGKYLLALDDLVKRYTAQKNFEAAIIVSKEIKRVQEYMEKTLGS